MDFGCFFEAFFWYFLNCAKNGAPHESIVNSSQVEGWAPGKSTKTNFKTEEKTAGNRKRKTYAFFDDVGVNLGGSREHFGSQNGTSNLVKSCMPFWDSKNCARWFWGGGRLGP